MVSTWAAHYSGQRLRIGCNRPEGPAGGDL